MSELHTAWFLVWAIGVPTAAVVAFGIQLRQVKKLRLENAKLALEIRTLEDNLEKADARIIVATNDEVRRIAPMASRADWPSFSRSGGSKTPYKATTTWGERVLLVGLAVFAGYLLYDLYRLGAWIITNLWP